jgi:hypothetical protein
MAPINMTLSRNKKQPSSFLPRIKTQKKHTINEDVIQQAVHRAEQAASKNPYLNSFLTSLIEKRPSVEQ